MEPVQRYRERIESINRETERIKRSARWFPFTRLILFLITVLFAWRAAIHPAWLPVMTSAAAFAAFFAAGWNDSQKKRRLRMLETLILIHQREIDALEGKTAGFPDGSEYADPAHPYAQDLDIFGPGSLFEFLNRTATVFGSDRLAHFLQHARRYSPGMEERQQAVGELAEKIGFRQDFLLLFHGEQSGQADPKAISDWLNSDGDTRWLKNLRVVAWVLPVITVMSLAAFMAGFLSWALPVLLVSVQSVITLVTGRRVLALHEKVSVRVGILQKYSKALLLIEKEEFVSPLLIRLRKEAGLSQKVPPSRVMKEITSLLKKLDNNLNLLVSGILNGLFLYNLHVAGAVERWRTRYRTLVPGWFSVLAEFDALASLGNFRFNHPGYVFPEQYTGEFRLTAHAMGHPLIPSGLCVTNDFDMEGWGQFRIITGANMSGKSTFLRTTGVNLVLAMTGAPVYAKRFGFTPVEIHSSIRTSDSLARRESYFYAELRRLREIIDRLEKGERLLILLDEILKGTNSADKQTGSAALIRHLMKFPLAGLFATHDLSLGALEGQFPGTIRNLCFEISIDGEKMEIDYRLRPGVSRNLNASFLMKKMGIIPDLTA